MAGWNRSQLIGYDRSIDRITDIETRVVVVPLPKPVAWSNVRVTEREFVFVWIRAESGAEGMGFTVGSRFPGGARVIHTVIDAVLRPVLLGRDAAEIERLWEDMYFRGLLLGTRGALMRGISAVDIALWDLLAKACGRRLCDVLGRYRDSVPAYASGGYYYDDDPDRDLALLEEEIRRHLALGFRDMKIKIGRREWREDVRRVERVLDVAGPGCSRRRRREPRMARRRERDHRPARDRRSWPVVDRGAVPARPDRVGGTARREAHDAAGDGRDRGRPLGLPRDPRGRRGRRSCRPTRRSRAASASG